MPKQPLVSIIIPTYNRAYLIGETLDSLLAQTYQNWECIVVDDGSTDNTDGVLKMYTVKDDRIRYYHRPKDRPKGANACRNYGFELSNGEYINWFDSDDLMLNNFIKVKIDNIDNLDIIITSGFVINNDKEILRELRFNDCFNLYKQYALTKTEIYTKSVMIKRNFLIGKELFDVKISRGQEADFFLRIFYVVDNDKYRVLEDKTFLYRQHEDTKTYRALSYVKSYKKSQAHIYGENFKKAIILKDPELFKLYYVELVNLLFEAAENRDLNNFVYILKLLQCTIFKKNMIKYLLILVLSFILYLLKTNSYTINNEMRLLNIKMM